MMPAHNESKSKVKALLLVGLGSTLIAVGAWFPGRGAQAVAVSQESSQAVHEPPSREVNPSTIHDVYTPVDGKGGEEVSGPYEAVKGWPKPLVEGWSVNAETIYAESPDRIIAVGRGFHKNAWPTYWGPAAFRGLGRTLAPEDQKREHMVVVYDRNGNMVESWDQWIPILPDVQLVEENPYDPEHHIWIATDVSLVELTHDGKTHVKTIDAKDLPQANPQKPRFVVEHFAWASNGDLYASGGYQVTKFSKDGKYLSSFGEPGNGPGQFGIMGQGLAGAGIHGIAIDSARNRLYIDDRVNSRIEVFDLNGKYLDQWPNIPGPYCIRLTKDGRYLWVSDGYTQKVMKYDALTGKLIPGSTWGTMGIAPGAIWGFHFFTTDSEGNLYVGEDMGWRIQKMVPRKDGSPIQLIGPLM
ncbi:MAG: hypothetical protein DMG31_15455 [Acidobacteria bacterium]|nr:MAG: hypothetical protein DMG31_15455 [Acidobacteriota bacterium]